MENNAKITLTLDASAVQQILNFLGRAVRPADADASEAGRLVGRLETLIALSAKPVEEEAKTDD